MCRTLGMSVPISSPVGPPCKDDLKAATGQAHYTFTASLDSASQRPDSNCYKTERSIYAVSRSYMRNLGKKPCGMIYLNSIRKFVPFRQNMYKPRAEFLLWAHREMPSQKKNRNFAKSKNHPRRVKPRCHILQFFN